MLLLFELLLAMFVHSLVKFGVRSGGLFLRDKANGAEIWPVSTFTTYANKHNKIFMP